MSCAVLRVQMIDGDPIQTQIIDQHVAIVRGYGGAMGVRSGLAFRVGAVAGVLKAGDGLAEGAVFQYPEGCGAAAVIVGDEDGFAGKVDRDIARASAAGGNRIDRLQLGGTRRRQRKSPNRSSSAIFIHLVDGVEMAAIRRQGRKLGLTVAAASPSGDMVPASASQRNA